MDICEVCKKGIKNDWDKCTFVNKKGENVYFCSEECQINFAKK